MLHRTGRTFLVAALSLSAVIAHADSITLRDGTIIAGVVKQQDGGYDVTLEDGKHKFVNSADVKSVKLSNDGKITEASAHERLLSLQRSMENERDIDRILDRYYQFITTVSGTEAAKQAQADLKVWQERKASGKVRVGKQWVTIAQRDAMLVASAKIVDQVRGLMTAKRYDDATKVLITAGETDPDNVSYAYLNGVLQLQAGQFFDAKRSFDLVAAGVDNHPPTLVNLAVLAAQFKKWPQAATSLDQALTLAPGSQEIIDDAIILLQLAPESARRTAPYDKLAKRVAPLETELEERQAKKGLFRLGTQWVDKAALEKAKADLDLYEKQKADLETAYQQAQGQANAAEAQIDMTRRQMQQIEATSLTTDAKGNRISRGLPAYYYDLQRDLGLYQGQLSAAQAKIADLRKQADVVKKNPPKPLEVGTMKPIDERGVPVFMPPTTKPSTQPTTIPATKPSSAAR